MHTCSLLQRCGRGGVVVILSVLLCAAAPRAPSDPDTKAWWALTAELSSDAMEGRDTGAPGYDRAAALVVAHFKAAGLHPGARDSYLQDVPMREAAIGRGDAAISVVSPDAGVHPLAFLHEVTVRPAETLPRSLEAAIAFRGYCGKAEVGPDVEGKILLCFGARRAGTPGAAERLAAAEAAHAVGVLIVDDLGFTLEPPRWPEAYARSVTLADTPSSSSRLIVMRLAADALSAVIVGSGRSATEILKAGAASLPLASFDAPTRLQCAFKVTTRTFVSHNVLGFLPGSDPMFANQVVVLSAHLDGYGYGEPVEGDALYNGAFDDAAYVALLEQLAARRKGLGLRRPILFAAFTGEEKGLLGAWWFVRHPTTPLADLAADINLDQIRPLFPMRILTMHAVDATTLGAIVRDVAGPMNVEIRSDREPERHLLERADHWPFLMSGVPATGFVFGYDPGTEAERKYRQWYQLRYHRPQDDMNQPIDFEAARDFNTFFYGLVEAVAGASARPAFLTIPPGAPRFR